MLRVGIIGAGSWGTALATTLARKQQPVAIWGRKSKDLQQIATAHKNDSYLPGILLPAGIDVEFDLDDLLKKSDIILLAVPSNAFVEMLQVIANSNKDLPIVWATKGLIPVSGNFLHEEVIKIFGDTKPMAYIGGPSFAIEVAKELPTAVVVASNDEAFAKQVRDLFHGPLFRVYASTDIIGAQIGGVIKNIIAVAAGVSDGLGFGANARAALITRGIAEMLRIGTKLGANKETLMGLAGCGDLVLTCTDNQSRNRRLGLALAKGLDLKTAQQEIGQITEAVFNAKEVCSKAHAYKITMPIIEHVNDIFEGKISPMSAFESLISRDPTVE